MRFADDAADDGPDGNADEFDALDDDFPLGDGTADTETTIVCPYCSQSVEIALDAAGGSLQEYVEDCEVCCQPWHVTVRYDRNGGAEVLVIPLDE
jgi:hypothetical protein